MRFVVNRWPVNRRHEGQRTEVIEADTFGAALEAAHEASGFGIQFEVYPDPTPEPPPPPPIPDPEPEPVEQPPAAPDPKPTRTRTSRKKVTT